ncbi:ParB/RepB/Spo0J family partition protein [Meridianimarinicoccus sp. RP-17]|uniref:ParB/RepB/Spo0J family partition protein n=1 Tax=Meridianimarinicoccus zhengii TaxID=2056810 RepID=UPI000DAD78E0|nr:ParB N-terminal domain-containing protein [Phycocomes zhengii]
MTRKRRMFDIEMPEDPAPVEPARPGDARRGPMASAVRENADSLRQRAEVEQRIRAENDALAHEYVKAQGQGLVMQRVPLDAVRTGKLTRDRRDLDPGDLQELCDSITAIGLSNPIRVERGEDGFELVQGLRRLSAFRHLDAVQPESGYDAIPAVVMEPGETLDMLYRRMVDENLIRADVSFAEMAQLAEAYAADPDTAAADSDAAVDILFGSAGKQKRSYIRGFARLLSMVGDNLRHAQALPRALGLALRKELDADPAALSRLRAQLAAHPDRDAEAELQILRVFCGFDAPQGFPAGNGKPKPAKAPRPARTTFQVESRSGAVKCTASQGRLELRGDKDFSALDRKRLEDAVARFLDGLE